MAIQSINAVVVERKKVSFTCKTRFCSSCGKIYVDKRAENMTNKLIKVKHRHGIYILEELRVYFLRDRELLSLLAQESYEVLKSYYEKKNKKKNYERIKNKLYAKYQEGFYVYGKGEVGRARAATNYVGRYTGRPAISNSRIVDYDGESVTIWYKDHASGKRREETMAVEEVIKRSIRHIPERQFKMVRYYGIYSSNTTRRPLVVKIVHEKIKEVNEKYQNWRSRLRLYYEYDPLKCEKCGGKMSLSDIIYPRIGSVMKLYEARVLRKVEENIPKEIVMQMEFEDG